MQFVTRLAIAFVLLAVLASTARADIMVKSALWMDQNDWKAWQQALSVDERAKLEENDLFFRNGGSRMVMYERGKQARVDLTGSTVLVDPSGARTVINLEAGWYAVVPSSSQSQQSNYQVSVQKTHETRVLLGHPTHLYKITLVGNGFAVAANDWIADDIPFDNLMGQSNVPWMDSIWGKINRLPLWSTIVIAVGEHTIKLNYLVQSVSTKPLPADTFTVPAGYHKLTPPASGAPSGQGDPYSGTASRPQPGNIRSAA